MDDDDIDRICAELHAAHDPVAVTRAAVRILAAHVIVTFSDPTTYDRAGRERAREEWLAAMPPVLKRRSLSEQLGAHPISGPWLTGSAAAAVGGPNPDVAFIQVKEPRHLPEGRELLDLVEAMRPMTGSLTEAVNAAAEWVANDIRQRKNTEIDPDSVRRRIWRWIGVHRGELHPELVMLPTTY